MRKWWMLALALMTFAGRVHAQDGNATIPAPGKLVTITVAPVTLQAGGGMGVSAVVTLDIMTHWHINANPPAPDYMVPTEVTIDGADGISVGNSKYPAGKPLKLGFEDQAVSVYDGHVTLELPLAASVQTTNGAHTLKGQLRFQSCNNQLCLAPAVLPFTVQVTVAGGTAGNPAAAAVPGHAPPPGSARVAPPHAAAGTAAAGRDTAVAADTTAPGAVTLGTATPGGATPPSDGFATAPPPGGRNASLDNPLARALDRGGIGAFLTLFLIGLALNLTPCVYPMLGVTVSIFGARKAAPPLQVFGLALLYVLGMASMYSALGLVAAFTGGLFGGFLQNPLVLVGVGVLLAAMALSMFGLYEIQLPAAIRERAGAVNASSAAGVFFSGLMVGVFAAPCIGPPVVALLAIVGAKGDPVFGFTSFFTLALGLGFPYLVLGTFSNLLQTLPRSGDWMEWVKKLFGVILLAIAVFYVLLGLAPSIALWVLPVALVAGGGYLGFIDTHADRRPAFKVFKRIGGAAAVLGGLAIVATTPRAELKMTAFTPASLDQALKSGKVAMVDFSADWCVPCHELERSTFTDARVIQRSRQFAIFKADLTRYDSAEAETWRKQYGITGVPTVVFLASNGREVFASRVEGFLAPEHFLERMDLAARTGAAAMRTGP